MKNQSLTGFLLFGWSHLFPKYLKEMIEDVVSGKLRIVLDLGQTSSGGPFNGIDSVVRGVEVIIHGENTNVHTNNFFIASSQREKHGKSRDKNPG